MLGEILTHVIYILNWKPDTKGHEFYKATDIKNEIHRM